MLSGAGNFAFLKQHDIQLARLGALAERYFHDDPNTCLIKLRQFGETLAQLVAAKTGLLQPGEESQADLLRRLKFERLLPSEVADLFHEIRILGNRATHGTGGTASEALNGLKYARQAGVWFHRTYGKDPKFIAGPFRPPAAPEDASAATRVELDRLRAELLASQSAAERAQLLANESARARQSAEERARQEADDRATWEQLAQDVEREKHALTARLAELQQVSQPLRANLQTFIETGEQAARQIDLDEAATRQIVDQQLRDRGWEADTVNLRYASGARPTKGRAMAIAEWPTDHGPADYALFVGLVCVGVVEAKRKRKNVSAAIDQAERYARGFSFDHGEAAGGPWDSFRVPFLFSTNGRPYLKQIETESGIWFRDSRKATNHRRALSDWFTPDGLKAELDIDRGASDVALKTTPFDFGFDLRPYQQSAIQEVETALAAGRRQMLLAMATGTGKTKLAIAMLYRLLAAKRFRRICFVVDRSALGQQAEAEFRSTKVVSVKTFADIFGLKGLGDVLPESETKVHICTIQGLVKRVLFAENESDAPPIDQYDLMVVDECHRGYLLDREMSDRELEFRSQDDYVSKYRRVLEHFDAVKIGLTATPALHTVQIFGDPIFTYSYREAVIDGFLIDHEPPIRIETELTRAGITFHTGEQVEIFNTGTGQIDLAHVPDEITYEVDAFNKRVITKEFNRVVAEELAKHIDPSLPGKTLVFAATDAHADILVDQIKIAMKTRYGEIEDAAVRKITGSVDRVNGLIRSYRNDAFPKIAVTVDLLTTGIDVPKIENLVFVRRVNSRILYEQMLGRATRKCDEIEKQVFRIFDAVDLYARLENLTDMKPVVVNPSLSFEQLLQELTTVTDDGHRAAIRDQLAVKWNRKLRKLADEARRRYEATAGEQPEATLNRIRNSTPNDLADWFKAKPALGPILDWGPDSAGTAMPISHHPDQLVSVTRGYGAAQKPEDFLDNFTSFVRNNVNTIAALGVVVQRPRELTRAQLRELRLELDRLGYTDTALRTAWQQSKNEDIAASVIGLIRQVAIGDPLQPYEDRVRQAIRKIESRTAWTVPQRQWLRRIGEQLVQELVVDNESLDQDPFRSEGGYKRLNKVFEGKLETLLGDINEEIWRRAG
jgi:type I restriction enzyme, R subunit